MTWIDGLPASQVAVLDRGLAYGDGLFETIRVIDGRPLRLERHLARLGEGCKRLALPVDMETVGAELNAFAAALGEGVAKLIVTRGAGQRGYAFPQPARPSRMLIGGPQPHYPAENAEQGVRLFPCRLRLAEQPALAGLKHLNRLEQVLARAEWSDPSFAEGLLRDGAGRLVEGVFSNLFLISGRRLLTPALDRCGVAGVMRAELLELAGPAGLEAVVSDLGPDALEGADEVFVCNSQYGIWPVVACDVLSWPVGPLTRKLQALLAKMPSDS
ncbi:aminodeoxychorismate lyase [Stutzerimonas azotifigens]|uniref:aminodeoxychorismate lyase n=1 Tax=Stutzerimonas azotifigens TaxID=291995 RepID=UPI000484E527|nr:aminodeoxychorismate lyase [Stutzerimonas azotifigens]